MAAALPTILQAPVINERISRLKVNLPLQKIFGFTKGGANTYQDPNRYGMYDVFNESRRVPNASVPGTAATTRAPQQVGSVSYVIPRHQERMHLPLEMLSRLRQIGGPISGIDRLGERYISDQEEVMAQEVSALREFQVASMLRGEYTYTQTGNGFVHGFSGGSVTVNYQIPSGNKSQLNMLGTGSIINASWATASTEIITHLFAINKGFQQLTGRGLTDVILSSAMWSNVINNTQVKALAGTSNEPVVMESFDRDDQQVFVGRLRAAPWIKFWIVDHMVSLNGTDTQLIPDTAASFLANATDGKVARLHECAEPIVEYPGKPATFQFGEYYHAAPTANPAGYDLFSTYNALPVLKIPAAIAYGTLTGF